MDKTTQTLTLTDFLLARIAEDEDRAKYETPHWPDCDSFLYFNEGGLPCTCVAEARMLAECEAKRRIVGLQAEIDDARYLPGFHYKAQMIEGVLRTLALPYADHPDYREKWRP
jgi:hypothetical protein